MNRRASFKILMAGTFAVLTGVAEAKKKKKGGNKKNNNNRKRRGGNNNNRKNTQKAVKVSGEIVKVEEDITPIYKIVGSKTYSFSRALEGKVKPHVGQKVTVSGRAVDGRILAIDSVTVSGSSKKG